MAIVYYSKYSGVFCDKFGNNINIDLKHRETVADGVVLTPISTPIKLVGHDESPAVVSYKKPDEDYKLNPLNGSEFTLNILADDDFQLSDLYTSDEKEWLLEISGGWNWSGYVIPDSCSEPFSAKPYPVTISATDGLGLLKDIPFANADGTKYTGLNRDRNILKVALEKTGLKLPMVIGVNTFDYTMSLVSGDKCPLDLTFIDQSRFLDEDGNAFSCEEVIRSILARWSARLHQFDGKWQIVNALELAQGHVKAYSYNVNGDFTGVSELVNTITAGGLNRDIIPVGNTQLAKAFKQSIGYYQYGYIANQLVNGDMNKWTNKPTGLPDGWSTFNSGTVTATTKIRQSNGFDTTDYYIEFNDAGQGGIVNNTPVQIRANETAQVNFDLYSPGSSSGSSNANSYISVLIQADNGKWFTNTGWKDTAGFYVITKNKTDYINQLTINFNVDPQPLDYQITFGVLAVGDADGTHHVTSLNNVAVKPTSDSTTKPAIGSFTKLESVSQQSYKPEPILLLHSDDRNEERTSLINIGSADSGSHPTEWYRANPVFSGEHKTLLEMVADTELRLHSRPYRVFEATFFGYDEIDINTLLTVDLINGNFVFLSGDFDLKTGDHNLRFAEALTDSIDYVETTAQDYGEIADTNSVGSPVGVGSTVTSSYVDNGSYADSAQLAYFVDNINSPIPIKHVWFGTTAERNSIVTPDPLTYYVLTDSLTPVLTKASDAEVTAATDDTKYITPLKLANAQRSGIVSDVAVNMVATNKHQVFSGSIATWVAPTLANNVWQRIFVKNRGTGALTINSNTGLNDFYFTSAVSTISLNPGDAIILINDGTYWNIN